MKDSLQPELAEHTVPVEDRQGAQTIGFQVLGSVEARMDGVPVDMGPARQLAERLAKVPTPAGPTPAQLGTDRAFVSLTAAQDSITEGNREHLKAPSPTGCPTA